MGGVFANLGFLSFSWGRFWKVAAFLALGLAFWASSPIAAHGTLELSIHDRASLGEGKTVVLVTADVTCSPGHNVLEAFVYVTRKGNQTSFASLPITCDGQTRTVTVGAQINPDEPIRPGPASVSGFVLVLDPSTEETHSVSPSQEILIVGRSR